jgi:hypothetical protein
LGDSGDLGLFSGGAGGVPPPAGARAPRELGALIGFSSYHKYTLGSELRDTSRQVVALVIRANAEPDKTGALLELRAKLDELLVLIRLAKEVQAFKSFAAYRFTVEQVASVCRQNEGWLRSQQGGVKESRARGPESRRRRAARPAAGGSEPI